MLIFISKKAYRLIFKGIVFFVKGSFFNRIQLIDVNFQRAIHVKWKRFLLSDCFFIYLYICYLALLVKNVDLYIYVSYCLCLYIFSTLSFKLSDRQIYERFWTCCSRCNAVNQCLFGSYLFVKESVSKMSGLQLFEVKNS